MNRYNPLPIIAFLLLLGACGDPCEELQTECNRCQDPNKKAACEATVDAARDDICEQEIESYSNICK